jgi:chemotaxis protein MotB
MRKKRHAAHENHERWLVSYADFITLLFAFFVVMFASSQNKKASEVSASVREALKEGKLSAAISNALGRAEANKPQQPPAPEVATPPSQGVPKPDLQKSLAKLQEVLADELKTGKVQVRLDERGLTISLREAAFFKSGDSAVQPSSLPTLAKVAAVVADLPNSVRLEGHTDSIPIHNSRFRSNWDLSAARAIAMLDILQGRFHIPTSRMAVAGYAENAPSDTNDTEEGRAHNRRVDVVVLSAEAMKLTAEAMNEPEPAAKPDPAAKTAPATKTEPAAKPEPAKAQLSAKPEPAASAKPEAKAAPAAKTASPAPPESKPVAKPESAKGGLATKAAAPLPPEPKPKPFGRP